MTETKWLTISEASLLSSQMGLERTPKTIRGWARNEHVNARKKSTTHGEMWILEKVSLETKIKTEIEYRDQMKASQPPADTSEPVQTRSNPSEPVRTCADQSGSVQTRPDAFGGYKQGRDEAANPPEPQADPSAQARIRELENKITALRIDLGWREKVMNNLTAENEKGKDTLQAQARYIGHLESDLMRLGGKPNQTFLAAPVPNSSLSPDINIQTEVTTAEIVQPQRPHPDQSSFYQNHSG